MQSRFSLCLVFILSLFFTFNTSFAQKVSESAINFDSREPVPQCQSSDSDPDGDGWGWENMNTCHVGKEFTYEQHPICKSSNSDPDGDGWGWENSESCKVGEEGAGGAFNETDDSNAADNSSNNIDSVENTEEVTLRTNFIKSSSPAGSEEAIVEFELAEAGPAFIEFGFSSDNLEFQGPVERNSIVYHKQTLKNLEAGREYFFLINSDGVRSEINSFTVSGQSEEPESLSFDEPDIVQANTATTAQNTSSVDNSNVSIDSSKCSSEKRNLNTGSAFAVANFHTMSVYWSPSEGRANRPVNVRFKPCGADDWRNGLDMDYNRVSTDLSGQYNTQRPDRQDYRGSIVHLQPNTEYIVELSLSGTSRVAHVVASTRNENFPVGRTVNYRNQTLDNLRLNNSHSGTSGAYTLIDGTGATINARSNNFGIEIENLRYAIIRGFKIINARDSGILIESADSVVIENNEITNWGSKSQFTSFAEDGNDAIRSKYGRDAVKRLVIQRNKIFNPAFTANTWSQLNSDFIEARSKDSSLKPVSKNYHSQGSAALTLNNNHTGNHIIRYNEFGRSTNGNYLKDGIGGAEDGSYAGFPGPNSDIYGNYVTRVWDDAIESEGGGLNVRIWSNYIHRSMTAIANAPVSIGPMYIWRNVTGLSQASINDSSRFGYFLKMGYAGNDTFMNGYIHIYNNSVLQSSNNGYGGVGISTQEKGRLMEKAISLNNIYHMRNVNHRSFSDNDLNKVKTSSTDYSLSNKLNTSANNEANGINGTPRFQSSNVFNESTLQGNFTQSGSSQGLDNGTVIHNFADSFTGSAPDIGAFENGTSNMTFGVNSNAK